MKQKDLSKSIPLRKNGALNPALIDEHLLKALEEQTGMSSSAHPIAQICFHAFHGLNFPHLCECGRPKKFKGFGKGYAASCGENTCRQESYKKEMERRYGVINSWQKSSVKEKIKSTVQSRYGVGHVMQTPEIRRRVQATNREKYGVDWVMQSAEKVALRQQNNVKKYGVKEPMQLPEIRGRIIQTNLEKRGAPWPAQAEGNRALSNATRKSTEDAKRPGRLLFESEAACQALYSEVGNLAELAKKYDVGHLWLSRTFRKFGITVSQSRISQAHKEIMNFLSELGIEYRCNDRTLIHPLELDILIENKLAIEIDGIYWHSFNEIETPKQRRRHLEKLELCERAGVPLIRITDVEWYQRKEILMSMIKARLGLFERRLFARKTQVVEVSKEETQEFLSKHHLLGKCGSSYAIGLRHGEELVALATFGKSRFFKGADAELLRFCCTMGTQVVGALGKLLKHAQKNGVFQTLVSYSTRDKFDGGLYEALGFKLTKISGPGYFYWHHLYGVVSRNNLQKHKLTKLPQYNKHLTEAEICFSAGYRRYWNCGTKTWILKS